MELQELREKLSNIQNMSTDIQELTEQEVLATFRGNRPQAIAEAEGRIASLTRQSLNVDRITEYDKLLSIEAEIKELEMFVTAETQRAISERKAQMEQEQKQIRETEKESAIREVMAEVESTKADIETEMQNTRRAIQDQKTARDKISKELVSRKEITRILTENLQVPTSSEEYKRASRNENDCVTKLRDIDKRTKKLDRKLEGLEQESSEIDSLFKECQELLDTQKRKEVEQPAEETIVKAQPVKEPVAEGVSATELTSAASSVGDYRDVITQYPASGLSEEEIIQLIKETDEKAKYSAEEPVPAPKLEVSSRLLSEEEIRQFMGEPVAQKREDIEPPVEEPPIEQPSVGEVEDEGMNDEYWEEYRKAQEQEEMVSREELEKEAEKRVEQEQVKQENEMWADYRSETKRAENLKQEEEIAAWKEKFAQEAKEEQETAKRTKQEIETYDNSLENGIDNDIDFTQGKKPEGQQQNGTQQPPKGAEKPTTPSAEKKPNPIINGKKYVIAKTGLHIKDNGEPAYFAILVDEQGNEIIHESKNGFEDIVKLDNKEAFELREKDGILDSRKYYDKGLANLLEEIDQMTGTTSALKAYKDIMRNKFNKNANRKDWLPIEYDFSNLYITPNDIDQKKKIEFVKKVANSNRLQKIVTYEKAPNILKRVLAKIFPKTKQPKLIEASKQEEQPDLAEQLAQLMPEGSGKVPRQLTTIQEKVDYYKQAREFPEFDMELFIQDCNLTEEQAQKFRAIHEKYTKQQVETIRDSYQQLRNYEGFDIEQFISDYGITGQEAEIYRASHANYLKNQSFRDSLREETKEVRQTQKVESISKNQEIEEEPIFAYDAYRDLYKQEGFDVSKIEGITPAETQAIQEDYQQWKEEQDALAAYRVRQEKKRNKQNPFIDKLKIAITPKPKRGAQKDIPSIGPRSDKSKVYKGEGR